MQTMTRGQAIKTFFESTSPISGEQRKLTIAEVKALTSEDKDELGRLSAKALGAQLDTDVAK